MADCVCPFSPGCTDGTQIMRIIIIKRAFAGKCLSHRNDGPVDGAFPNALLEGINDDAGVVAFDELLETDQIGGNGFGRERRCAGFAAGSLGAAQVLQGQVRRMPPEPWGGAWHEACEAGRSTRTERPYKGDDMLKQIAVAVAIVALGFAIATVVEAIKLWKS